MVSPYSVRLATHTGLTPVELTLRTDPRTGQRSYREFFLPSLGPRTILNEDQVTLAQVPPEQEIVWDQRDWSRGQGAVYYADGFYSESSGVETRRRGEVTLGRYLQNVHDVNNTGEAGYNVFLVNTNAENANASANTWVTGQGATVARDTAVFNEGVASWRLVAGSGIGGANDYLTLPVGVANLTGALTAERSFQFVAMARVGTGQNAALSAGIGIRDQAGSGGATETTSRTFAEVLGASVTLLTTATDIRVRFGATGAVIVTTEAIAYVDQISVTNSNYAATARGYIVGAAADTTTTIVGLDRMVFTLDENGRARLQKITADAISHLARFQVGIIACLPSGFNALISQTPGTPSSWAVSSTTPYEAIKAIVVPTVSGRHALARAYTNANGDSVLALSANPLAASPTWSTDYIVGDARAKFHDMALHNGIMYVAKEDGLFRYEPFIPGTTVPSNHLVNVRPESRGTGLEIVEILSHRGWLYCRTRSNTLLRYDGTFWQDLQDFVSLPTHEAGEVRRMASDDDGLYLVVEGPSGTFHITLLVDDHEQVFRVFDIGHLEITAGDTVNALWVSPGGMTDHRSLWVLYSSAFTGGTTRVPQLRRFNLSNQHRYESHAQNPRMNPTGQLVTSYQDWNAPDVVKSFNLLTLLSEALSTARAAAVDYQIDNVTTWTTLATFVSSPTETVSFPSGTTGRRIRLRYRPDADAVAGSSGAAVDTPIIKGHVLRGTWRPTRLRAWEMECVLEQGIVPGPGLVSHGTIKQVLDNLDTLRQEAAPLQFRDIYGNTRRVHIQDWERRDFVASDGESAELSHGIRLLLYEARTS